MRCALYIRVSTEEQAAHGYSLAEQREACRSRALELGAREILEFADEGVSGATLERSGLDALREAVRLEGIDCLVVRDPDRLSRRLAHQLLLTEEFEKKGVRFEFLDFDWKDTPEGRLFYSIKGAVSEYEREKIRERMVRGKLQKARQGGIPVCFDVYGYHYDPETGMVGVYKKEAEMVLRIFTWYTTEDIGVGGIANRLNDMGVPTRRRKGPWHRQVVRQILANPVYLGEWRYGKMDWRTKTPKPPEMVITIPVPALIRGEVWEKAEQKMQVHRRLWAKRGKRRYLLSGIITCTDCGNSMGGVYSSWWGDWQRRYTCRRSRSVARNRGCQPPKMLLAERLEQLAWDQVKAAVSDCEALVSETIESVPRINELQWEHTRLQKNLQELEKGRESVLDALASGLIDLDEKTKSRLVDLKQRKERLDARLRELDSVLSTAGAGDFRSEAIRALAAELLAALDDLDFEEKRALARAVISQVQVAGRPKTGCDVIIYLQMQENQAIFPAGTGHEHRNPYVSPGNQEK